MIPKDAKPGDFILVHESGEGGWLVETLQAADGNGFSEYEHVALYTGGQLLIEMNHRGIQVHSVTEYDDTETRWSTGRLVTSEEQQTNIVKTANYYLNRKIGYSWADYGAIAAHRLHIPVPGLKEYIGTSRHMICSQFVDQCWNQAGYHIFNDNRWPGYVTPGDLNLALGPA